MESLRLFLSFAAAITVWNIAVHARSEGSASSKIDQHGPVVKRGTSQLDKLKDSMPHKQIARARAVAGKQKIYLVRLWFLNFARRDWIVVRLKGNMTTVRFSGMKFGDVKRQPGVYLTKEDHIIVKSSRTNGKCKR